MLELKEITLADKGWIDELLQAGQNMSCEYCFGNLFIWKNAYRERIARINDHFTVEIKDEGRRGHSYLYPVGKGDVRPVIEAILAHCEEIGVPFHLHSVMEKDVRLLEECFPGKFVFSYNRDLSDYIYTVRDLTELAGKKYHGKRNHITRFKKEEWSFEPITGDNYQECLEMNREWCRLNDCGRDEGIKAEMCAIRQCFAHFEELGLFGGILRQKGRIVAYTIGESLNNETVCVHVEKAFSDVEGAYPAINREFVANMCQNYTYVNREEDLGVEGLRRAKLSYKPELLLHKYEVCLKEQTEG